MKHLAITFIAIARFLTLLCAALAFAAAPASANEEAASESYVGLHIENGQPIPFRVTVPTNNQGHGVLRFFGSRACSTSLSAGKVDKGYREYDLSQQTPKSYCERLTVASIETRPGKKIRVTVLSKDGNHLVASDVSTPGEAKDDPASKALLGAWVGTCKGDCALLRVDVRDNVPGTAATVFRYGHPRNCASKVEYEGFVKGKHYFQFVGADRGGYCEQVKGMHIVVQPQADGTLSYDIVANKGQVLSSGTLDRNNP